jgi:hypothetical protein
MEFALVIVALVALLALAFWMKRRRLRRASLEIIECFREHRAVKEGKAKTLEEMGLRFKPKHPFMMRDDKVEALSLLLQQGIICPIAEEGESQEAKFFLNEGKCPVA